MPAEAKIRGLPDGRFVGGQVRLSRPVEPGSFATLKAANAFCAGEFGAQWRVLSFHEAGGAELVSISKIAAGARGVVHVGDHPYANCWDRPTSVKRS